MQTVGSIHNARTHGPDGDFHNEGKKKSDAEAWEKEGQKFSAWELITGCWRSKQQTGAPKLEKGKHAAGAASNREQVWTNAGPSAMEGLQRNLWG